MKHSLLSVNFPVIHVNFRPRLIRHSKSAHGALHSSSTPTSAKGEDQTAAKAKAKGGLKVKATETGAAGGAVVVTGKNCRLLKEDALGSGVHTQQGRKDFYKAPLKGFGQVW